MLQQSVYLKVVMLIPQIKINHTEVVLFCKYNEGVTFVPLHNIGPIAALYKWKKLTENWRYVKEV